MYEGFYFSVGSAERKGKERKRKSNTETKKMSQVLDSMTLKLSKNGSQKNQFYLKEINL